MIDEGSILDPAWDVTARGRYAQLMPLTECGSLHAHSCNVVTAADDGCQQRIRLVVIEVEVVFQRVGANDVAMAVGKATQESAGPIFATRNRLEPDRHIDVVVWAAGRDDHVEVIVGGALNQSTTALGRIRHILDVP